MKITFLGGGNMANALIGGLLKTGSTVADIAVIDALAEARTRLKQTYGIRVYAAQDSAATLAEASDCAVLLLAVKPQQMQAACLPLRPLLQQQLVISIAAGLRLSDLSHCLGGYQRLVRAMPNTPALIGAGISGLYATPQVSAPERQCAERRRHGFLGGGRKPNGRGNSALGQRAGLCFFVVRSLAGSRWPARF